MPRVWIGGALSIRPLGRGAASEAAWGAWFLREIAR